MPGSLLGALSIALLLIAPAAAGAATRGQVREELRLANQALDHVWQQTGDENDPQDVYDLGAVDANLAHTETARELAAKLDRGRFNALAEVATQADENLAEYIDDTLWAPAELQPRFADAVADTVALRNPVIRSMLAKPEKLTPGGRAAVLSAITSALSDGDPDFLLEVLAEEEGATAGVKRSLIGPLERILLDNRATLEDLRRMARLARGERDRVQAAIQDIEESLDGLPDWVDELLADIEDFALDPEAARLSFCALLAELPLRPASACD